MAFAGFQKNFVWFLGVVEDIVDPYKLNRVRVRCFGIHPEDKSLVTTTDLPWALTIVGSGMNLYKQGDWVCGFMLDGEDCQQPLIIGGITNCPITKQDQTKGFSDPQGVYPLFLNEGTNSRIQRNENIDQTSIGWRRKNVVQNVTTGDGSQWGEPATSYSSVYPYNRVIETPGGHVIELDDTPGSQRVAIYHCAGSFLEMMPDGTVVYRAAQDRYNVVLGDDYMYAAGDVNISVGGDANILTGGDINLSTGGNLNWRIAEDCNIAIGGNTNFYSKGNLSFKTDGDHNLVTKGNSNHKIGASQNTTVTKDLVSHASGNQSLNADGTGFFGSSGQTSLKSGSTMALDGSFIHWNEGAAGNAQNPGEAFEATNIGIGKDIAYSGDFPTFAPPSKVVPDQTTDSTQTSQNSANSSTNSTTSNGSVSNNQSTVAASVQPNSGTFANQVSSAVQSAKQQAQTTGSGLASKVNINSGVASSVSSGNLLGALGGVKAIASAIGATKAASAITKATGIATLAASAVSTVSNIVSKVVNIGGVQKTVQVPPSPLAMMTAQYSSLPQSSVNTPGILPSLTPNVPGRGVTSVVGSSTTVATGTTTNTTTTSNTSSAVASTGSIPDPRYRPLGNSPTLPAPSYSSTPARMPTTVSGVDNTGMVNNASPPVSLNIAVNATTLNPNAQYVSVASLSISDTGLNFIKSEESLSKKAYYDVNGWAIGYGSHQQYVDDQTLTKDSTCTVDQATKYLLNGLKSFQAQVKSKITAPITQGMFDALVSICYNAGSATTLFQLINNQHYQQAANLIPTYKATSGGQPNSVLATRRKHERDLFSS